MSTDSPYIGIDFGTTYASMAWYNPGTNPPHTGQAETILNSDGDPKTPSTVYFGEDETLVGQAEGVRPRYFAGTDHLHRLVCVPT